ncbi:transposable element Tcb1 transposase [Trichonephila clavipes]|nr:transposable element Tcb1 transposase [Trichonephila clavipes]
MRTSMHVRCHLDERTLPECICHRHTGRPPVVMAWDVIGYTSLSHPVCIEGTLNRARYISVMLRPVYLPFTRALRNLFFQQVQPHVADIIQTFFDMGMFGCCPGQHVHQISLK